MKLNRRKFEMKKLLLILLTLFILGVIAVFCYFFFFYYDNLSLELTNDIIDENYNRVNHEISIEIN